MILNKLIKKLPLRHKTVIRLRFWDNQTIEEIAKAMRLTWNEANQLIEEAKILLRNMCLNDPAFSLKKLAA